MSNELTRSNSVPLKRRGRKPEYPVGNIQGDKTTDRKSLLMPVELYQRLLDVASELNYTHKGCANVLPLLDAIADIEIEKLEELLREEALLPKQRQPYRGWV